MSPPLLIVGAGLTGSALAFELASRGRSVLVLERAIPGAEASSAAAGILAPRMEAHGQEPLRSMGVESLGLYPGWLQRVSSVGGPVDMHRSGLLALVEPGQSPAARHPDPDAVWCDPADVHRLAPHTTRAVEGGWWLSEEGWVDPRQMVPAVHRAAAAVGAVYRSGTTVARVHADAVELVGGEVLRGRVVVCAGAWTGLVPGLAAVPVEPVRGQLVSLALPGPPGPVIFAEGGYLVPRTDERLIVGTTVEHVGFQRGVTLGGMLAVLGLGARVYPELVGAELLESWSGFRPTTPDHLPVLGAVDGVHLSSGHYRNGILLAPLCARWMADALLDGAALPARLRPERFGEE